MVDGSLVDQIRYPVWGNGEKEADMKDDSIRGVLEVIILFDLEFEKHLSTVK